MSKSRILLAGAALFVTLICWSLSSPINSHQDEKFHLASIWCADGFNENCEYKGLSESRVETVLLKGNLCTPANAEDKPYKKILIPRGVDKCKFEYTTNMPLTKMSASPNFFYETDKQIAAWISPGHTPSRYYQILNLIESKDAELSVLLFRFFNSLVFVSLLTIFFLVSEQRLLSSTLLGLSFTLVPHGLFLVTDVSNSSWSYAGCSLSWAFLHVLINQPFHFNWKTWITALGWTVSSGIVVSSRYDATVYLVFTNLAVVTLNIFSRSKRLKTNLSVLLAACSFFSWLAWVSIPKIQSLGRAPKAQSNSLIDLLIVFGNSVKLSIATPIRILGLQSPGWGPLQLSHIVFGTNLLFWSAVVFVSIHQSEKTQKVLLFLVYGFLFAVFLLQCYVRRDWTTPFYLIRTSWAYDEFYSRYFIPYFPFMIGVLVFCSTATTNFLLKVEFKNALLTILALTQAVTLYEISDTFRKNPSWYWQKSVPDVNVVFFLGTISFVIFLYNVIFFRPIEQKA